nr:MBL fold metallo-hydrolase [uncultured Duganella sp.]
MRRVEYQTNRVDYVVNSHPDGDHASGLSVVLEELDVGQLRMHQPWHRSDIIRDYFHDGRMTEKSLAERLKRKMGAAHELEAIAMHKKIPVHEPFQGDQIGIFTVLSPHENWYTHELIREFAKSPMEKKASAVAEDWFSLAAVTPGWFAATDYGRNSSRLTDGAKRHGGARHPDVEGAMRSSSSL